MCVTNKNIYFVVDALLVIFVFVLAFMIADNTALNSAPDEHMRYSLCNWMFQNSGLPDGRDEAIRDANWGFSYAFAPYISQIISSWFMRFTSLFTSSSHCLAVAARFTSILSITGYAFVSIKIGNKLFNTPAYKYLFFCLVALLPQVLYLGSYINNDSFALFAVSLIVYSWIIGLESKWSYRSCLLFAVSIGLCLLSYYNAYGWVLCSFFIYIFSALFYKMKFSDFFKKGLLIFAIVFLLAGWFFIRNYIIYNGDILGLASQRDLCEQFGLDALKPSNRGTLRSHEVPISTMLFGESYHWVRGSISSFIGVFGYLTLPLNPLIILSFVLLYAIGFCGVLIHFIKIFISKFINVGLDFYDDSTIPAKQRKLFNLMLTVAILIPIMLSLYYSYFNDFQAQGRYVICLTIPFMYFVVLGLRNLFNLIIRRQWLINIIVVFLCIILAFIAAGTGIYICMYL